jgi:ABC-2 type transport system ATP-binding protein
VAAASQARVEVRTARKVEAMAALAGAGATVAAIDHDLLTVTGLDATAVAGILGAAGITFSELGRHRASLEAAYMELTRDHSELHAGFTAPGGPGGAR